MNILFICNQGQNRSRKAANLFKNRFKTKSAGLHCDRPVTKEQLLWADVIVVMENQHRSEIAKRFPQVYLQKRILSLDIPDIYRYGQPKLVDILKYRMLESL
ncbi:phosphotyrosine protein phosphatase [Planctomycetota bacterium]